MSYYVVFPLLHLFLFLSLCQFHSIFITLILIFFFFFFRASSPNLVLLQIALTILGHLFFHVNFRVILSNSTKNTIKILIGIALNLSINSNTINNNMIYKTDIKTIWEILSKFYLYLFKIYF